jgi:hypothetical protein
MHLARRPLATACSGGPGGRGWPGPPAGDARGLTGRTGETRSWEQRLLGHVQHPEMCREVLLTSGGAAIALSVWRPDDPRGTVVLVPGTATHPLLSEEFLDRLAAAGLGRGRVHLQAHGKSPRVPRMQRFARMVNTAEDGHTIGRSGARAPRRPRRIEPWRVGGTARHSGRCARWVDLVVVDADCHLILNEALDVSVPAVLAAVDACLDDVQPYARGTGA